MMFGKKKETATVEDIKEVKTLAELLDLRAISLDVKLTLEGANVECKSNKIAKRLLLDVLGVSEDDFKIVIDIMTKAGQEIGAVLEKYGEVLNESKKKDKN